MISVSETPAMLQAARVVGSFAAVSLMFAVAAWVKPGGRSLQRLDGRSEPGQTELAARLLVLAFGLSALAAALAIVDWIR
ncbi:MAG: hypothetical protein ACJ8D6_03835 [Sphingomicrobium sp.]